MGVRPHFVVLICFLTALAADRSAVAAEVPVFHTR